MSVRMLWVRLHRYAGLATAAFLLVAGLTGSVLTFHHELDAWLNPDLFRTDSQGPVLDPVALAERLEREDARLKLVSFPLRMSPGDSVHLTVRPRVDSATGKLFDLDFDELFVDPVTGQTIGKRLRGECCLERKNLIPFLYRLHYSLYIPGNCGIWLMGIVALTWTVDTLVGCYLTFPMAGRIGLPRQSYAREAASAFLSASQRSWWQRWSIAWRIKRGCGASRFNLDLHRAGGLWFFGILLALAVSGVSFNLRDAVFEPIVSLFSPLTPSPFDTREERAPADPIEPRVRWLDILRRAEQTANQRGWRAPPASAFYNAMYGIYGIGYGDETEAGLGASYLYFDGEDGRLLGEYDPRAGTAGDIFAAIQLPLHSGRIAGLPGRITISLTGLVVALLASTGVLIWLNKRRALSIRKGRKISRSY